MNEQDRNEFYIHPTVEKVLRITGAVLLALILFFSAKTALTFCLGLFADGEYLVQLPWQESPLVAEEDITKPGKTIYVDPTKVIEIARVDLAVAGDLMMHMPIVRTSQTEDGYDFDGIFSYISPYIASADFAVVNLETTLAGSEIDQYTGAPYFNSPDEIAQSAKKAGFDMLLTGNNHCYDYGTAGLKRTLEVVRTQGLEPLGTFANASDPRHGIYSIGGIRVGMTSYTFADLDEGGVVTINGKTADAEAEGLINAFDYDNLSRFYTEIEGEIESMEAGGAEMIILYIHWGEEFSPVVSDTQRTIAQSLCDLGVDVIVGSHPHVVQPLELLTSSADPTHKTICLYSAGSFLGNLRADTVGMAAGYSEDGALLNLTLAKYNDGSVRVSAIQVLPTWILVQGEGETRDFFILPLDSTVTDWSKTFGIYGTDLSNAKNSYSRTMELVTPGLNAIVSDLSAKNSTLDPSLGVG